MEIWCPAAKRLTKLLLKILNSKGLRRDPWGTLDVTSITLHPTPYSITACVRSVEWLFIQEKIDPSIP